MILEDNNVGALIIKNVLLAKHDDGTPRNHHVWLGDDVDDVGVYLMVDGNEPPIKICAAPYGHKLWEAFEFWIEDNVDSYGIYSVPSLSLKD